jgi:hypothetical protein
MKKLKLEFLIIFLVLAIMPISDCEKYTESDEINGLIMKNDLSINMKVRDDSKGVTIDKIYESDNDDCLKIEVTDTYSLRGEDSFMLTLLSGKGTFYIKEINIEHVK